MKIYIVRFFVNNYSLQGVLDIYFLNNYKGKVMDRGKKLKYNTVSAFVNQIITIIHGFVLPRFYLQYYGSTIYGLSSSVTQFLSVVTLMEMGIGAVVQSALYEPLAKKDKTRISKIVISAERFFRKIALAFLIYTIVLMFIYPNYIQNVESFWFEASLIAIIAISSLAEYFFGMTYRLLLMADQRAYITLTAQSVATILNFVICIILMYFGASIHVVKLSTVLVMLMRPIVQSVYVHKNYDLDKSLKLVDEPIKQKWNGVAQHLAYYVTNNTDTVVLSIFSTLENVSIYSIYNMITNGIRLLILTLSTGIQAMFGNMLVNHEFKALNDRFKKFEWEMHTIVVIMFSCVGILIVPFISVYTKGINDANYYQPVFAILITLANAVYCIRLPYNTMVLAAGHYKQTQMSSIVEMLLNVFISIFLVFQFGLIGVAIGTLIALAYRTVYLAIYLSNNILEYSITNFLRNVVIDFLTVAIIVFLTYPMKLGELSYISWIVLALQVFVTVLLVVIIINLIFNKKYMLEIMKGKIR